jgi:cytochrome c oxidase assembly factor CtaG
MRIKYILFSAAFLLFAYIVFRVIIKKDYKRRLRLSPISYLLEIIVFAFHANLFYLAIPAKWPYLTQIPEDFTTRLISAIKWNSYLSQVGKPCTMNVDSAAKTKKIRN